MMTSQFDEHLAVYGIQTLWDQLMAWTEIPSLKWTSRFPDLI